MPSGLKGIQERVEKAFGLPRFERVVSLISGETGERVERILDKFEKLAEQVPNLPKLEDILRLFTGKSGARLERSLDKLERLGPTLKEGQSPLLIVKELNDSGAIERLDGLLDKLIYLSQTQAARELIEKLKEE